MHTWFDAQSALVVHGVAVQMGSTQAVPPPTMLMHAHALPGPHWLSQPGPEQATETACADAGVAEPRTMGAT
jgi:hypothetical protein